MRIRLLLKISEKRVLKLFSIFLKFPYNLNEDTTIHRLKSLAELSEVFQKPKIRGQQTLRKQQPPAGHIFILFVTPDFLWQAKRRSRAAVCFQVTERNGNPIEFLTMPNLYIIAGCNGAGKTTASFTVLPEMLDCEEFVNADEIARGLSPLKPENAAIEAGRIMLQKNDKKTCQSWKITSLKKRY